MKRLVLIRYSAGSAVQTSAKYDMTRRMGVADDTEFYKQTMPYWTTVQPFTALSLPCPTIIPTSCLTNIST